MGAPIGTMLGMIAGGLLSDALGWRLALIMAGGFGGAVALATWLLVPDVRSAGNDDGSSAATTAAFLDSENPLAFAVGDCVVHQHCGVGRIASVEDDLFVINFERERMTLRIPCAKMAAVGVRKATS